MKERTPQNKNSQSLKRKRQASDEKKLLDNKKMKEKIVELQKEIDEIKKSKLEYQSYYETKIT